MNYIGITLIIAILIATSKISDITGVGIKDIEYISYVIILVQISALTILFGFIIMLYPVQEILPYKGKLEKVNLSLKKKLILILILSLVILIFLMNFELGWIKPILNLIDWEGSNYIQREIENSIIPKSGESIKILKTIGELLYTDNNMIIKLIILTLILLIAIVAIFYII